jgi:cellulose synthase/poly-beta-1,6-N-acetylglucosamine synthase-like glycosyltransferase
LLPRRSEKKRAPLHTAETAILSLVALGWLIQALRAYFGMRRVPRLTQVAPLAGNDLPRISVLFAARDEAEKLPRALASLLALDYPDYEIVAVDDRSTDATPRILDECARTNPRLQIVHIRELPPGWLGKPHALEAAYQRATGDWLVFTDADVRFAPDLLRRALALAERERWDHLTLLARIEMRGFWETVAVTYFNFSFIFGFQPWRVANPRSGAYMGVGAFQLLRRSVYDAIGTHRRLAMEVVDDMKLGKLVKEGGYRSGVASSEDMVQVRWQEGFFNIVRGVTKNMFAAMGFSIARTFASIFLLFLISILPFLALGFAHGPARVAAGISAFIAVVIHGQLTRETGASPLYGLAHPLGALIFAYMIVRSMVLTLWRGGIIWRDTFYPLKELRKGSV